jgi:hypothetical protein
MPGIVEIALISVLFVAPHTPYAGRWDLTITGGGETYPSWMEVSARDGTVTVVVVGREGGPHGAENINLEAVPVTTSPSLNASTVALGEQTVSSRLAFTTLESFGNKNVPVRWTIESSPDGKITGVQKRGDGVEGKIAGEHAPPLKAKVPSKWTSPQALSSAESFQDFRFHVEVNCPKDSSGGILLRGRYRLALGYKTVPGEKEQMGSVAGFIGPAPDVPATPGTWESFDVTLVGRIVSVTRNGTLIVDNKEIPGITAGALDSHERQKGPILLQASDTAPIQFRNATISVPAR